MKKYIFVLVLLVTAAGHASAQTLTDDFLQKLLLDHASPLLQRILDQPDSFHYQLIYTQINRDKKNKPSFKNYYLHVDKDMYFNPASTVKLPAALVALEKLNKIGKPAVNRNTTMLLDSSYSGQSKAWTDSTSADGLPSVAQYIKRVFLISDNDAYNRLYEFDGQQTLNESLRKKGYKNTRITRSFARMNEDENRHTSQVRFVDGNTQLYLQPPAYNNKKFDFSKKYLVGKGYMDKNDSLVMAPMDFTTHNKFSLEDMQKMLQTALFPESVSRSKRFQLTESDYKFLYQYMSEYPSESTYPTYDTAEYFDSYTKFFFFKSGKQQIPSYMRVFNKAGWSYGFLTDIAYIVDYVNGVEFMLTGTIYTNSDGILNDDKYDYDTIGYPFFAETGKIIYDYELQRERKFAADLSRFVVDYRNK